VPDIEAEELGHVLGSYLLGMCRERSPQGLSISEWEKRAWAYIPMYRPNTSWARTRLTNIAFATIVKADYCGLDIPGLVRPPGLGVLRILAEEVANRGMTLCETCGSPTPLGYAQCCLECGDRIAGLMPRPLEAWLRVLKATSDVFANPGLMCRALPPGSKS
jgi:hypothetical protein